MERIHRVDHDTLVDDLTIEDPKAYTKSWKASQTYHLITDYPTVGISPVRAQMPVSDKPTTHQDLEVLIAAA